MTNKYTIYRQQCIVRGVRQGLTMDDLVEIFSCCEAVIRKACNEANVEYPISRLKAIKMATRMAEGE